MSCCGMVMGALPYVEAGRPGAVPVLMRGAQTCERIQSNGTSLWTGWSLDGSGTYSPGPIFIGVCPNELAAKNMTFMLRASALATTGGQSPCMSSRTTLEFSSTAVLSSCLLYT